MGQEPTPSINLKSRLLLSGPQVMDRRTGFFFAAFIAASSYFILGIAIPVQNLTSTDESSLVAFKTHITSDHHKILKSWSSSTKFCNWFGVSCNYNRRVIALNLSGWSLGGTIAPHLGNLTFLTSLDISYNNFSGFIPSDLASLRSLKLMDVAYNNLCGDVPSGLGTFPELQHLLLRNNSFTGRIPPSLGNISNLETLDMSSNILEGKIPLSIGNLSILRTLILGGNQLIGSIPTGIFFINSLQLIDLTENSLIGTLPLHLCNNLSSLNGLYLSFNNLYGTIPTELCKCKNLEFLSLLDNQLGDSIPKELGYLAKLKLLDLSENTFIGGIPKEIGNLTELVVLNMRNSMLTGEIPPSIFNISSLSIINLSNNSLSGSLPADMSYNLPSLEKLNLHSNQLSGHIPPLIWDSKALELLELSENKFYGSISERVGNLTSLRKLYLDDNNFTGELPIEIGNSGVLEELELSSNKLLGPIPLGIFNMSSVTYMRLSRNNFSGTLPSTMWITLQNIQFITLDNNKFGGVISSSISNATKLSVLSVTENSLTGTIPDSVGNLRFLKGLFLGANNLTRDSWTPELRFIASLTNCRHLQVVELSLNQFNGFLPPALGNFSDSLKHLSIFNSQLKGKIPNEIGNLSSLQSIFLDNNQLAGFIPATIGKLKRVEAIYLEHNRLEGFIPTEFCQLKNLWDLYLNENMLSGAIPHCLGELKSLRRIYLHLNNLSSTIPLSLWNLNDLFGLNLSYNSLSGRLPPEIKNLKVITELDLSGNEFSGDIPSDLGNAPSLVFLSLSHNRFEGEIPLSFGDLISLEFLDLSHNDLSGMIPRSLEKLKYLKHLNLSANRLEGQIPSGGAFANFPAESFLQNYAICGSARLHFPACRTEVAGESSSRLLKYILPPIASAILLAATITYLWIRKSSHMGQPQNKISLPHEWRRVSYYELLNATEDFSENNLLGSGSFGSVYKGTLSDGSSVAVKVFHMETGAANKRFESECEILATIRHRNLVRILSCCSNPDFKALVLDYISNGNLDIWLHSGNHFLDLQQRINIAIDVASALEYLHHYHKPAIVHCDVKPSNILLDDDMNALLCDFSIARLFEEGNSMEQTKTLATIGYMAPEYGSEGRVSPNCDVYSYGVILLEIFTKRKPTDDTFGEGLDLKRLVSDSLHRNSVKEIVDANLIIRKGKDFSTREKYCMLSIFHLAMDCLADSPEDRINMRDIAARVQTIRRKFLKNFDLENFR